MRKRRVTETVESHTQTRRDAMLRPVQPQTGPHVRYRAAAASLTLSRLTGRVICRA